MSKPSVRYVNKVQTFFLCRIYLCQYKDYVCLKYGSAVIDILGYFEYYRKPSPNPQMTAKEMYSPCMGFFKIVEVGTLTSKRYLKIHIPLIACFARLVIENLCSNCYFTIVVRHVRLSLLHRSNNYKIWSSKNAIILRLLIRFFKNITGIN